MFAIMLELLVKFSHLCFSLMNLKLQHQLITEEKVALTARLHHQAAHITQPEYSILWLATTPNLIHLQFI